MHIASALRDFGAGHCTRVRTVVTPAREQTNVGQTGWDGGPVESGLTYLVMPLARTPLYALRVRSATFSSHLHACVHQNIGADDWGKGSYRYYMAVLLYPYATLARGVGSRAALRACVDLRHLDTWRTCAEGPLRGLCCASLGSTLRRPVLPIAVSLSVPVQRYRTHPLYGAGWGFSEFEVSITNA